MRLSVALHAKKGTPGKRDQEAAWTKINKINMQRYPVRLEPDTNGTIRVNFPDVPEAHTFGENIDEALMHAVDALETAFMLYIEDRRDIPKPSPVKRKDHSVALPALTEAKLALYSTMRTDGVGKAELGRQLNWHLPPGGPPARFRAQVPARSTRGRVPRIGSEALRSDSGCGLSASSSCSRRFHLA